MSISGCSHISPLGTPTGLCTTSTLVQRICWEQTPGFTANLHNGDLHHHEIRWNSAIWKGHFQTATNINTILSKHLSEFLSHISVFCQTICLLTWCGYSHLNIDPLNKTPLRRVLDVRPPSPGGNGSFWFSNGSIKKIWGPTHYLVGGFNPSGNYQSMGRIIPYMMEKKHVWNHQPVIF